MGKTGGSTMTLNLSISEKEDLKPRITVFGVGGAGGNAVNNMIEKQLKGVDFVVATTKSTPFNCFSIMLLSLIHI